MAEAKPKAKATGYTEDIWRGSTKVYACRKCPFDTTDVDRIKEHVEAGVHLAPKPSSAHTLDDGSERG